MLSTSYLLLVNVLYTVFTMWILFSVIRGNLRINVSYTPMFSFTRKAQVEQGTADEHADALDQLSPVEQERLRELQEMDARFAQMREELAQQNFSYRQPRQSDIVADESDGVKNLPHDSVTRRISQSMLEVAD